MKRFIAVVFCIGILLSLVGCTGGGEGTPTLPTAAVEYPTLPEPDENGVIDIPQIGDYVESIFLSDVPGQGAVYLLKARSDGTVDYIFGARELDMRDKTPLVDLGIQHYVVYPDGRAVKQPTDWAAQLDAVMAAGLENSKLMCARCMESCEGEIIISLFLIAEGTDRFTTEHFALYRIQDGGLVQIPLQLQGNDTLTKPISDTDISMAYAMDGGFYMWDTERYFFFSWDGALVNWMRRDEDTAYNLVNTGEGTLWFENMRYSRITTLWAKDLTEIDHYDVDRILNGCRGRSPITPDGAAYYELGSLGTGHWQLRRISAAGEEILIEDGSAYAFGAPEAENLYYTVANDGTLYVCTADNGSCALRQYRYAPEGARNTPVLTVFSLSENKTLRTTAALWNRTHSQQVQYIVAEEEAERVGLSLDDYMTQFYTRLVNGEGPDVLLLDGLPADSMIEKGFLAPLTGLNTQDVFPRLLERFSVDGMLYAIPAKMIPVLAGRAVDRTQPVTSLTAFADTVVNATPPIDCGGNRSYGEWDNYKKTLFHAPYADGVFSWWYPAYSTAIWEGNAFQEAPFRELLTQTGRIVTHYNLDTWAEYCDWCESDLENYDPNDPDNPDRAVYGPLTGGFDGGHTWPYAFGACEAVGFEAFCQLPFYGGWNPLCEITGIPGPDGKGVTVPCAIAALREGGNTEIGLEFLQLLLSDEIQETPGTYYFADVDGYPVKRNCVQANLQKMEALYENTHNIGNDLEEMLSGLSPVLLDEYLYTAARLAASGYYMGELTLDQAAAQVEAATRLYLAEQRQG